ncbi:BamA/TamA family outer membrane protein [uncultured Mucilaginibacter sp.]|uniref:BamA/TamA family outer membrane protein n=1 Tax=uncultured Mucilaginibacter sp. TaxID=797541 RepID=UPI0025EF3B2C|nr:BamA/TamA family outer membrane protein [uncultured Mucilaginibacter sp.]
MLRKFTLLTSLLGIAAASYAQQKSTAYFADSTSVKVHPSYNQVSGIHKWLFGKNYREEWATTVKLPLIKISEVYGGLKPLKQGGGLQSKSLRLEDKKGKEWVIRSVEKTPDKLLPPNFRGTFAIDWLDDALSSQHPYSALVVPPLADAAGVPHANPVIGVIAPDAALGEYSKIFNGLVVLLEEREPTGKSDNTDKMLGELKEDNDNRVNGEQFLKARMLDLLLGDWDRHEDQWRWAYEKKNKDKKYYAVPRDRDQVFHISEGVLPSLAARSWISPTLDNFDGDIPRVKYSLIKTRFIQPLPDAQISYNDWMRMANDFVKAESDEVLEASLKLLPPEVYKIRHDELFSKLKQRRNNIPAAMDEYYRFVNKTVDLRTTDKNEQVIITDAADGGMRIQINKISKAGEVEDELLNMVYNPQITHEIRLYTEGGNDKMLINYAHSPIRLRIVGAKGQKTYDVQQAESKVRIYNRRDSVAITGNGSLLKKHLSNDSLNTQFVQNNPYNVWMPLATGAINPDDGILLGAGFKYTRRNGFRKLPYASVQQLLVTHAFATDAFRIKYNGEWIDAIGKADIVLNAFVQAPNNTLNFFGRGNETPLFKFPGYRRFYRTRYNTYQVDAALRWWLGANTTLSAGPSFQYYRLHREDNEGRFINNPNFLNSYDSLTVNKDKAHIGLLVNFNANKRNSNVLPSNGYYVNVTLQAYNGLNSYTRSFAQIRPEFTYYFSLNAKGTFVISDRVGGGLSVGKPAFYQSMFLGGQGGNLLGYLGNRFAGDHMFYNNLQTRLNLFNIAGYVLPGQLGVTGFYDTGRVWVRGQSSNKWHAGTGGGVYFAPAGVAVIQVLAGHSTEGWYPYVSLNVRL